MLSLLTLLAFLTLLTLLGGLLRCLPEALACLLALLARLRGVVLRELLLRLLHLLVRLLGSVLGRLRPVALRLGSDGIVPQRLGDILELPRELLRLPRQVLLRLLHRLLARRGVGREGVEVAGHLLLRSASFCAVRPVRARAPSADGSFGNRSAMDSAVRPAFALPALRT